MNKLDNQDKHKILIPLACVTELRGVSGFGPNDCRFTNNTFPVGSGGVLNFLGMPGPITITSQGGRVFAFFFNHEHYFPGLPVLPTLQKLHKLTLGVIETLDAHLQGAKRLSSSARLPRKPPLMT